VLFPLTITALNQSGDALEGATIEVVDALNEDAPVDVYDIDGQVIASPVTDPDGMADLYLRNGYVKHRFTQGLYTSRWVTDLALAPPGRAGRWQDTTGGTITAGQRRTSRSPSRTWACRRCRAACASRSTSTTRALRI
jgi:hypothetical protein